MQYKTIVLHLLEQRPEMYEHLRKKRLLLPTMDNYSQKLKKNHEAWKTVLSQARPGSDPRQIASEALELALEDMKATLPSVYPPDQPEVLSLDDAMAFIRRPTPPG